MRRARSLTIMAAGSLAALALASSAPAAGEHKVVVTIKPVHALVASVMAGVGMPELLVKGTASPHAYSLRPSEVRALHNADLFFRMSASLEPFTVKVVKSLPRRVRIVHHDPKRSDMELRYFYEETVNLLEQWNAGSAFDYRLGHDGDIFWF